MLTLTFLTLGILMYQSASGATNVPLECSECVQLMTYSKVLSPQVVEVASFLCDRMSGDYRHLCRDSLKDIGTRSPQNICEMLDVCPTMADTDTGDLTFTAKTTPLNKTTQHAVHGRVSDRKLEETFVCHMCVLATTFIHNYLSGKNSQKIVMYLAKLVCNFLPFLKETCISLVDTYGPFLLHLLQHFISPKLCQTFLNCGNATLGVAEECAVCRLGVGIVYDFVNDPALDSRIADFAQSFCEDQDQTQCQQTAVEVSTALRQFAEQLKRAPFLKTLCQDTDICPRNKELLFDF